MSATALRAPAPTPIGTPSPPRAAPPASRGAAPGRWSPPPALVAAALRLAAAGALALFGAGAWAGMVEPRDTGAVVGAAGVGIGLSLVAAATARLRPRRARVAALAAVALLGTAVAIRLAGVPERLLDTDAWDELAAGIGQGVEALPTTRVPYRGVDEWIRIVMLLGGTLLAVAGPVLAGARRREGAPVAAAIALAVLYGVPAVQLGSDGPWVSGALFAILLAALLFGHRLRRRDAPLAAAAVVVAALAGIAVGPRLDADRPWVDYEAVARSLGEGGTQRFSWGHGYGPLRWPRENREVLRVRAREAAYWKATTLTDFDGVRWREVISPRLRDDRAVAIVNPRWRQDLRVTVRDLTSEQFIGAGSTLAIERSPRRAMDGAPGSYLTAGRPLKRGHSYVARVYAPRPTERQLARAGAAYADDLWPFLSMRLPRVAGGPAPVDPATGERDPGGDPAFLVFPPWGQGAEVAGFRGGGVADADARRWLRGSRYRRAYALARRLAAGSSTPYAYARAVEDHLGSGFTYTETPGAGRIPLDAFLFDTKAGYCQHFAGAMALLLRMGGVPARVASGFSPGVLDEARREYVVTDLDAHSWVEAWFPRIGWVTFDPTPSEAPARRQLSADQAARNARDRRGAQDRSERAGDARSTDGGAADPGGDGGGPWTGVALAVLAVALVALAAVRRRRRRRRDRGSADAEDPRLAELQRALRRAGRDPRSATTLTALEHELRFWPDAAAYVREVRSARFGYGAGGPTRGQRRALRDALAGGSGPLARLRGWWAVPPLTPRR